MKTFVKTQIQPEEPNSGAKLMNHIPNQSVRQYLRLGLLCLLALSFGSPAARAGLTVEIHLYHDTYGYYFYPWLNANTNTPDFPTGNYMIASPQIPTNGSQLQYQATNNTLNFTGGGGNYYGDFNSFLYGITNGQWSIWVTNSTSTNQYKFTVSVSGITSNIFGAPAVAVFPTNGAQFVTSQPLFQWTGPANWGGALNVSDYLIDTNGNWNYEASASLPPNQTSWPCPTVLPNETNDFRADYTSNVTAQIVASTPQNNASQPISGWVSTAILETYYDSQFTVGQLPVAGGGHTLIAHYAFDDSGNHGLDSSGNGNDFSCGSGWGPGEVFSTDAIAGAGAIQFFGGSSMTPCGQDQSFTSWTTALSGSFTVSAWIKTTTVVGDDGDDLRDYNGQSVIYADNNNLGATPVALTGSKVAFRTTDPDGNDDTLHSIQSVTTGNYVHIVSTRDQTTGEKKIYINGTLDSSDIASTEFLSGAQYVSIGGELSSAYSGLVDDVQIYSGVLSANEVANLFANPGSTAANGGGYSGGHLIVARYNFEQTNAPGVDSSGHGNDSNCGGGDGNTNYPDIFSTDAAVGSYSRDFQGHTFICFTPPAVSFSNLASAFSGSFSVSAWVKTTQSFNNDSDNADAGAFILFAEDANTNSTVPLALTGSKVAISVNDHNGNNTTLHSLSSVNDGQYHQIAVTRNQASGLLKVYVDGNLEGSASGSTDPLYINSIITLGGYFNDYNGLLDDVQIYSGVLADADVASLFANPGSTVPDVSGQDFGAALGTTNLNWATTGDTSWFVESTNTYNGSPSAAQSGSVTNNQSSTLSVTVTGPGTLTFYWASLDDCYNFDYEFDIDGNYQNDIYCSQSWIQDGPYTIPAGQHTLSWTTYAYGDTDPTEAGFLDNVSYVLETGPVITVNPFDQTNYPGYPVWLAASVATNSNVTWQWYKVGAGAISGATSASYIPTNSGTPGVQGSYYAIASNLSGSANTTTAAVSFVSAPLPPDWSTAFKSAFTPVDLYTVTKDYYYGCIVDAGGNVYAAAQFSGNTLVGSSNLNSGAGGFAAAVVKQSPTGAALWAVGITNNGAGSSSAYGVASAPGGGVYLAGNYSGNNWLGTTPLTDAGNGDMFLARFDGNGSNLWVRTFGGTNTDFTIVNSLAADPSGNVTLLGLLGGGPMTIGTSNYNVVGQEGVVIQLDQTGAVRWSQLLPNEFPQYVTDSAGRLYVSVNTATSGGTTNVVIGGVTYVTDRTWAVACLNGTNGHAIWVRGVGTRYGSSEGNPYAGGVIDDVPRLAVSGTNVFLTGAAYDSSATFGAITVNFGDLRGQYFARYDINGNAQVATTYGSLTTTPFAAVADTYGNVYVSGDFDTFSWFGNNLIATPVATRPYNGFFSQAFLAKFDLNGNPLWARTAVVSTYGTVNFSGLALATDGVWASGWCQSGYYPEIVPVVFGTNNVFSDPLWVSAGAGGSTIIIWYPAGVLAKITDNATVALPVTLLNPQDNGVNFQFQFQSQAGVTNSVQYRTNLVIGNWLTYTNVTGDGTLKTSTIPLSVFSPSKQGFIRVSTQ